MCLDVTFTTPSKELDNCCTYCLCLGLLKLTDLSTMVNWLEYDVRTVLVIISLKRHGFF